MAFRGKGEKKCAMYSMHSLRRKQVGRCCCPATYTCFSVAVVVKACGIPSQPGSLLMKPCGRLTSLLTHIIQTNNVSRNDEGNMTVIRH